jgi:hypothetical protein
VSKYKDSSATSSNDNPRVKGINTKCSKALIDICHCDNAKTVSENISNLRQLNQKPPIIGSLAGLSYGGFCLADGLGQYRFGCLIYDRDTLQPLFHQMSHFRPHCSTFLLVDSLLTDITKKLQLFADVAVILAKAGIQTSKSIT